MSSFRPRQSRIEQFGERGTPDSPGSSSGLSLAAAWSTLMRNTPPRRGAWAWALNRASASPPNAAEAARKRRRFTLAMGRSFRVRKMLIRGSAAACNPPRHRQPRCAKCPKISLEASCYFMRISWPRARDRPRTFAYSPRVRGVEPRRPPGLLPIDGSSHISLSISKSPSTRLRRPKGRVEDRPSNVYTICVHSGAYLLYQASDRHTRRRYGHAQRYQGSPSWTCRYHRKRAHEPVSFGTPSVGSWEYLSKIFRKARSPSITSRTRAHRWNRRDSTSSGWSGERQFFLIPIATIITRSYG